MEDERGQQQMVGLHQLPLSSAEQVRRSAAAPRGARFEPYLDRISLIYHTFFAPCAISVRWLASLLHACCPSAIASFSGCPFPGSRRTGSSFRAYYWHLFSICVLLVFEQRPPSGIVLICHAPVPNCAPRHRACSRRSAQLLDMLERTDRTTRATAQNAHSSRSHAILQLAVVEPASQSWQDEGQR
eukprot:1238788-Pleurochrysis_carterae.AAC.1